MAERSEVRDVPLPGGGVARLCALRVRFARATPNRLREGMLPRTYTSKPLVSVRREAQFGGLAILRVLELDSLEGVWVDTFHGRKFWRAMPHRSSHVTLPSDARRVYDEIVAANGGKASGAFDVMAWRGAQFVFLEYKGEGDRPNRNEAGWIAAALRSGVSEGDLWFVLYPERGAPSDGAPTVGPGENQQAWPYDPDPSPT